MGAAFSAVPVRFPVKVSIHHTADRTGLAAGEPLLGLNDAGAVPAPLVGARFWGSWDPRLQRNAGGVMPIRSGPGWDQTGVPG